MPPIRSLRTVEMSGQIHTTIRPSPISRFAFGKRASSSVGDWVSPRDGLDIVPKKKSLILLGNKPQPSSLKSVI
jgi:hypothetical protein